MGKFKCLIADDNILERDLIEMYLSKMRDFDVVAKCSNGLEVLKAINNYEIDLVFSDIEMPELTGLSVLSALKNPPVFIFISSYSEYATESYNLDVVDFILKPVAQERFRQSVKKATQYLELKKNLAEHAGIYDPSTEDYFFILETKDLVKLNYDEVFYMESMGDFSRIYTINQKQHISLVSLKSLETQLPDNTFTRVHKQYLINHRLVSAITPDEIVLTNNSRVPVSNNYRQALLDKVVKNRLIKRHPVKD